MNRLILVLSLSYSCCCGGGDASAAQFLLGLCRITPASENNILGISDELHEYGLSPSMFLQRKTW